MGSTCETCIRDHYEFSLLIIDVYHQIVEAVEEGEGEEEEEELKSKAHQGEQSLVQA